MTKGGKVQITWFLQIHVAFIGGHSKPQKLPFKYEIPIINAHTPTCKYFENRTRD